MPVKDPSYYRGREQTYLKQFFLERYLERVAYNVGWSQREFVYVDGFSGPWRSEHQAFEDTSFIIALQRLRRVREGLTKVGRCPRIRCVFVESNPKAFTDLARAVESIDDFEVRIVPGEFENVLPQVIDFAGPSFCLTFLDPTGWTGFALRRVSSLLQRNGEVLINFMFDYINRFRADQREGTERTFDDLFGGPGWNDAVAQGEEFMLEFYQDRLKSTCSFTYATRTRILKPLDDRTYFYIVYATRHPKGLVEFRKVERELLQEQERVRADATQSSRRERTGQGEFFRETDATSDSLESERRARLDQSGRILLGLLRSQGTLPYEIALPRMLEVPMVHESAARKHLSSMGKNASIVIEGLGQRARLPGPGCRIRLPD